MRHLFPVAGPGLRVGLLGGSFDPPHEGHVRITEEALRRFELDRVWWLVSPGNPLKAHGPAPLPQRLAAGQALMQDPRVVVTGVEAALGTRMTVDTIAALQHRYSGVRFTWLMGADNLVQFNQWDRWREIACRVPIGVLARPGSRLAARSSVAAQILRPYRLPEYRARELASSKPPAWVMINVPMSNLSSTALRARSARDRRAVSLTAGMVNNPSA